MAAVAQLQTAKGVRGLSRGEAAVRAALVAGYVGLTAAMFFWPLAPRVFWTIGLPLLPILIVLAGFYPWRKVCPLAFWGSFGSRLEKPRQRRVPAWMERWYPVLSLALLWVALAGRLLSTNGDGPMLATLLIVLAAAAALTNGWFTGKTWCNFVCPVSIVERIYTEPNSLQARANAQCSPCTACKRNCPDIDQEGSYWKDVSALPRRIAYFSFPGLVLGFYTYFWLRAGDWEAYFGGGWTSTPFSRELLLGPGFFFAPSIPAIVAAPLALFVFSAISFACFAGLEAVAGRFLADAEMRTHRMLSLAAFAAFNLFYLFAGAPTLRHVEHGPRALAFVVPLVSTTFLVKRWRRSRGGFHLESSARKLVRSWKFAEPPPEDPAGVFAYFRAREHAHEAQLAAYRESVLEVHAAALPTRRELELLDLLRRQLDIGEAEHRKIVAELTDDQRAAAARGRELTPERRLQLEGYREALAAALLAGAPAKQLRALQADYGIEAADHEQILAELRNRESALSTRARAALEQVERLRAWLAGLSGRREAAAMEFLWFALRRAQDRAAERVLEALALAGESERVRDAARRIRGGDPEVRRAALTDLRALCDRAIIERLEPALVEPLPAGGDAGPEALAATLAEILASHDPYLRAGAVHAASRLGLEALREAVAAATADADPLVREAALSSVPATLAAFEETPANLPAGGTAPFATLSTLDRILLLRRVPVFADLDPEDLHEVCSFTAERVVPAGGVVCAQGETTDDLFVLVDGRAAVTIARPSGAGREPGAILPAEREVAELGAGDVIGELAAIDQSPRSATVRPKGGDLRLLQIRGADFRQRLASRTDVSPRIMSTLSRRLRDTLAQEW